MARAKGSFGGGKPSKGVYTRTEISVNFWGMCRDLGLRSMDRGQLPVLGVIAIVLAIIVKLTPEQTGRLLDTIFRNLTTVKGVSYLLNVILAVGWATHVRWFRNLNSGEMDRLGREKTRLQEDATNRKLAGS